MTVAVLSDHAAFFGPSFRQERADLAALSVDTEEGLPEGFTPDFCIRNTFIDSTSCRRPSLEDFLPRARCLSAPSTSVGVRMRIASTMDPVREEEPLSEGGAYAKASSSSTYFLQSTPHEPWSDVSYVSDLDHVHETGVRGGNSFMPAFGNQVNELAYGIPLMNFVVQVGSRDQTVPTQHPIGSWHLGVVEEIPLTDASVAEANEHLPSDGSIAHSAGLCKPCAWYHSAKGCKTGTACKFCHLCAPGELKRRKREKNIILAAQNANNNV